MRLMISTLRLPPLIFSVLRAIQPSATGIVPEPPQYITSQEVERMEKTRRGERRSTSPPIAIARPAVTEALAATSTTTLMAIISTGGGGSGSSGSEAGTAETPSTEPPTSEMVPAETTPIETVVNEGAEVLPEEGTLFIDEPQSSARRSGKKIGEAGKTYEEAVRQKTGRKSEIINGREIDSVTDEVLIQAKDSNIRNPKNFLNKKGRAQIKETIRTAEEQGKKSEFWFAREPPPEIRQYIEGKGGKVIVYSPE